jgi:hypothetical protein
MLAFWTYQPPTGMIAATPNRPTVRMPIAMRTSVSEMARRPKPKPVRGPWSVVRLRNGRLTTDN